MRNFLLNLGLLLCTIVLFFGSLELVLNVAGIAEHSASPAPIYRVSASKDISYELKPNMKENAFRSTIQTDGKGFRVSGTNESTKMIAVLGDSITFGYGVNDDETVPANIQKLTKDYRVINAGVAGYNLEQETAVWSEKIDILNPEVLVLITHFNDIENKGAETAVLDDEGYLRSPGYIFEKPQCSPIERGLMQFIPAKCWLDLHSNFYRSIKILVNSRSGEKELAEREQEEQAVPTESVTEEDLRIFEEKFQTLASKLPQNLIRIFVIWPEWRTHEEVRPVLKRIAEENGFTVVDLYDTFGNTAETLGWDTVHPSANTTKRAAEVIWKEIERRR